MDPNHIRNFAIIAHIDHGKSTLSDRLLELTGSLTSREMQAQVLDAMDLERERGITIKAHTVRMMYKAQDGETYQLNLIDTPGHVDFSYEVSRSLASCEGALLVVDASQGVEAQTLANAYLAINHGLEVIPIINKIDLPSADIERTREMIEKAVRPSRQRCARRLRARTSQLASRTFSKRSCIFCLRRKGDAAHAPLQALIFDSWFDPYRISASSCSARIINGRLLQGMKIKIMSNGKDLRRREHGRHDSEAPAAGRSSPPARLASSPRPLRTSPTRASVTPLPTMRVPARRRCRDSKTSRAWSSPASITVDFARSHAMLRDALEKLRLNDSSFTFEPESSVALGFGFRCGFLGLLHLEIIQERLEREYDLDLITTRARRPLQHHADRWGNRRARSITHVALARPLLNIEAHRRAGHPRQDPHQRRIRRRHSEAGRRISAARQINFEYVSETRVMITYELPAERDRPRLLRPSEICLARLCFARLPHAGPLGIADGEDGYPDRRRSSRRALHHRSP